MSKADITEDEIRHFGEVFALHEPHHEIDLPAIGQLLVRLAANVDLPTAIEKDTRLEIGLRVLARVMDYEKEYDNEPGERAAVEKIMEQVFGVSEWPSD